MNQRTYAIAGLSVRGIYCFALPILGKAPAGRNDLREVAKLTAIVDPDRARADEFFREVEQEIPYFTPEEFPEMLQETKPDAIIVTGPDYTHHRFILAALEAGCDAVTEKPMVISSEEARSVLTAEAASGKRVFMAHNYRYAPSMMALKSLLLEGRIGRVANVEFTYNLDTFHGASYFFRWNRERANSGGLNMHKCCHHFDLINWLLGDQPETLSAFGRLNYYGPKGANRPLDEQGNPLPPAEEKARCPYFQQRFAKEHDPESNDISTGWDQFRLSYEYQYPSDQRRYIYDDVIDIEDTYGAIVEYRGGPILTYSCNFSTPWEGYTLGINGTKGRIEISRRSDPDPTGNTKAAPKDATITIYPLFGGKEEITVAPSPGGHDGADPVMQRDIFCGQSDESRHLGLMATSYQGALAVCEGEAVFRSLTTKQSVAIKDLLGEHYRP